MGRRRKEEAKKDWWNTGTYGVLDGICGDDGGVVAGGVGGEAVGDDADGDVPLDDDVAPRRGRAAPDAGDADAGLAVPALELEVLGHGRRGDLICDAECGASAMRSLGLDLRCACAERDWPFVDGRGSKSAVGCSRSVRLLWPVFLAYLDTKWIWIDDIVTKRHQ